MPHPKAPFCVSDGRVYDVVEYRTREEWNWENQLVLDFDVIQRIRQRECGQKEREDGSGFPLSFRVIIAVEPLECTYYPPPEPQLVGIARYCIQCWLESNGLCARYHDHRFPITLEAFS